MVNNAIGLIDYTSKLRQRGLSLTDAVAVAGATRLRPDILTAVATFLTLVVVSVMYSLIVTTCQVLGRAREN